MSIDSALETIPTQRSRDLAAGPAPEEDVARSPLSPAAILRTVLLAEACEPLSGGVVTEATKHRDRAGQLLAAAVLYNLQPAENESEPRTHGLLAYMTVEAATEQLKATKGSGESAAAKEKQRQQRARWQTRIETHRAAAHRFSEVLRTTSAFATDFETAYTVGDKLDKSAIADLYDATDMLDHPVMYALPNTSVTDSEARHGAIVQADRLLRYIILTATNTDPIEP